jgi:hypothetical protein
MEQVAKTKNWQNLTTTAVPAAAEHQRHAFS